MGKPGASQLLELAGQATICYVVQDEAYDNAKHIATAPLLQLEGMEASDELSTASLTAKAGAAAEVDIGGFGLAGWGVSSGELLQPEAEQALALRLAGMCRDILAASICAGRSGCACKPSLLMKSSSSGSEQNHDAPCGSKGTEDGWSSSQGFGEHSRESVKNDELTADRRQLYMLNSAGTAAPSTWLKETHARMAEQYCLQRTLLLARVAADLECQALLVS